MLIAKTYGDWSRVQSDTHSQIGCVGTQGTLKLLGNIFHFHHTIKGKASYKWRMVSLWFGKPGDSPLFVEKYIERIEAR